MMRLQGGGSRRQPARGVLHTFCSADPEPAGPAGPALGVLQLLGQRAVLTAAHVVCCKAQRCGGTSREEAIEPGGVAAGVRTSMVLHSRQVAVSALPPVISSAAQVWLRSIRDGLDGSDLSCGEKEQGVQRATCNMQHAACMMQTGRPSAPQCSRVPMCSCGAHRVRMPRNRAVVHV
jgi:hypothetical protein